MAQPSQRKLWCAFSDGIDNVFSIYCTLNVDTIDDVKKKICMDSQRKTAHMDYWKLKLYSPVSPVKDNLTEENLVYLHPRKQILSDFPQSNDPEIDIIIIQPQGQQQSTAPQCLTELDERRSKGCTSLEKSPKSILRTIQQAFPQGLRYQSPRPLVRDNGVDWVYQPHEELEGLVQPVLEEHFKAYLKGSTDKNNTPLYLFLGGAGTGKSRNAMEFPQTLISCSDKDSDLRRRLVKAKVFLVSLENGASITWLEDKRNLDLLQIIGTRMLLQLLHGETYFGVDRVIQEFEPPWPIEVLQSVAQGEGEDFYNEFTGIVIVDGVQNFLDGPNDGQNKESKFYRALARIAELPLQPRKSVFVVPCCTATMTVPTHCFLASSHRNRVYLPLKSLDPPMIAVESGNLVPAFCQSDHLIKLLVIDCGGHARALEALYSAIDDKKVVQVGVDNILQCVQQKLANRYSEAIRLVSDNFLAILRAVWIRLPLREDEKIPGTEMTVEQVIQPGLIRFESDGRQSGYLTAPYIWVWLFLKSPNNNLDPLIRDWSFWDYADIHNLLNGDPSPGMRTWQNFESHCAHIRAIKSKVLGDGCVTKLSSVHFGARLNGDRKIQNLSLDVRLAARRHATKTTQANKSNWKVECCDGEVVDVRACRDCIVNAANAPGGDFFVGLQAPDGSPTGVEVCQCKYYTADTVTEALFRQEYEKSVSAQDFFMLLTTAETSNFTLPKNSGIVDAGNWFDYFGPWANRLFMFHQVILGDDSPSLTNQKKRKKESIDYNYEDVVDGKKPSPKRHIR